MTNKPKEEPILKLKPREDSDEAHLRALAAKRYGDRMKSHILDKAA